MTIDIKKNFRDNKGLWIFLGVALLIAVLLGVFVSPWASSSPDGLEKVAEDKGFLEKAEAEKPAWTNSPMKDYAIPGVKSEKVSTALSGLTGVLITVVVAVALALLLYWIGSKRKKREQGQTPIEA